MPRGIQTDICTGILYMGDLLNSSNLWIRTPLWVTFYSLYANFHISREYLGSRWDVFGFFLTKVAVKLKNS